MEPGVGLKPTTLASAIKHDFWAGRQMIVLIYARGGMGKSSYSIQVAKQLYDGDEWRKYIVWSGLQFADVVENLVMKEERIPVLIVDDATKVFFYMHYHHKDTQNTLNWIGLARTRVTCLILTTQVPGMLLRPLRDWEGILKGKVVFGRGATNLRNITFYEVNVTPYDKKYKNAVMEDIGWNVMLPQRDFDWYQETRQGMLDQQSMEMIDYIRKKRLEQPLIPRSMRGEP